MGGSTDIQHIDTSKQNLVSTVIQVYIENALLWLAAISVQSPSANQKYNVTLNTLIRKILNETLTTLYTISERTGMEIIQLLQHGGGISWYMAL